MSKKGIFEKTFIPGLLIVNKPFHLDERGFLQEIKKDSEFKKLLGKPFNDPHVAFSCTNPGVIRGVHTEQWRKLVVPATGKMFGAYADTRPDSPTFGKVLEIEFDNTRNDTQRKALIIPPGVGNSICNIGNDPIFYIYLNEEEWEPTRARGIAWDDPDLNINWPIKDPIISDRDRSNPTLRELFPDKFK